MRKIKELQFRLRMRKTLQEASLEEIRITKDEVSKELCRRAKEKWAH